MFFSLMPLIKMIVLIINAIAILNEDRFLARIGWAAQQPQPAFAGGQDVSIKGKIVNLISATRLLTRIPLIGVNSVIIIYELLLG
ncbi:Yos1-like protein [Sphaerosporella brunnea]|uniref:Yos1-like protein n=1 Tax=Sphaerosporella brunnea TaxID=1250544 RepID=A0A5J5EFD9_9PEZI|nr:Yos1-like protein [Sphaerosporella brunnea]